MEVPSNEIQNSVFSVLSRQVSVDAMGALIKALQPASGNAPLSESAVAFDANVFLRLASHRRGSDITDYFRGRHTAPLILPGQAIQEFWNNQLAVVDTMEAAVRKDIDKLERTINSIDADFSENIAMFRSALDHFANDHSRIYSSATVSATLSLLNMLRERAIITFCDRSKFAVLSQERKQCRTPPGFKDSGDGDFFVWVETLCALGIAREKGIEFNSLILVTNDKKEDWSRSRIPHPILFAEVEALYNASLRMWSLDELSGAIPA